MGTELAGYRKYKKTTATATTATQDIGPVDEGHKVYWSRAAAKTDKANADVEYYIVSGGQEFMVNSKINLTANLGDGQAAEVWVYEGEYFRAKWSGIASADILEFWVVGTDKWEKGNA